MPFLNKYQRYLGRVGLEVGPFFDPILVPAKFPGKSLVYLDNDPYAIKFLRNGGNKQIRVIFANVNLFNNKKIYQQSTFSKHKYDFAVMSQIFNYIDYQSFLTHLHKQLNKKAYIFVNNATNYGIPSLFSKLRPRNTTSTIQIVKKCGFKIIEKQIIKSLNNHQHNQRLLLVAQKK